MLHYRHLLITQKKMNNTAEQLTSIEIPKARTEASGIRKVDRGFNASETPMVANPVEREMLLIKSLLNKTMEVPESNEDFLAFLSIL